MQVCAPAAEPTPEADGSPKAVSPEVKEELRKMSEIPKDIKTETTPTTKEEEDELVEYVKSVQEKCNLMWQKHNSEGTGIKKLEGTK